MMGKSLAAGLAAMSMLAASGAAHAACSTSDRPETPNNPKVMPAKGKPGALRVTWIGRGSKRVWWDIEVTDTGGRVVQSFNGVERRPDFAGFGSNETRCFRIRARTGQGTQGCVSQNWTERVCGTTAGSGEKWGALAADGKGAWGFAINQASESAARDAARRGCGNARCMVKIAGPVGCYAYFESRTKGYSYGYSLHSSGATAVQGARSECEKRAPAGTCKLVKSNC